MYEIKIKRRGHIHDLIRDLAHVEKEAHTKVVELVDAYLNQIDEEQTKKGQELIAKLHAIDNQQPPGTTTDSKIQALVLELEQLDEKPITTMETESEDSGNASL